MRRNRTRASGSLAPGQMRSMTTSRDSGPSAKAKSASKASPSPFSITSPSPFGITSSPPIRWPIPESLISTRCNDMAPDVVGAS